MALQLHSKAGAFSPGSDLWILPQIEISNWTRTLDWYLNFQVSRVAHFEPKEISDSLKKIMEQSEFEPYTPSTTTRSPLLIASASRLPNQQTVIINFETKIDEWFKNIKLIWYKLGRPKMRVFLPKDLNESEIIKYWPNAEEQRLVSFVPNPTGLLN